MPTIFTVRAEATEISDAELCDALMTPSSHWIHGDDQPEGYLREVYRRWALGRGPAHGQAWADNLRAGITVLDGIAIPDFDPMDVLGPTAATRAITEAAKAGAVMALAAMCASGIAAARLSEVE